ncbi:MAG: hypothetical protein H6739_14980 [Alphaproteobacteria bacterium]|nr:hypothetical protein [Alphaproteobacteria bacterium]
MSDAPVALDPSAAGAAVDAWVEALQALRLNKQFPPWRQVAAHLRAMADVGLKVDRTSGLPAPREWLRVRTAHELAAEHLAELMAIDLVALPPAEAARIRAERDRLERVMDIDPLPTRHMEVALRHLDGERASWRVLIDRLDLATATLARYSLILSGTPGRHVSRGELELKASEAFARDLEVLSTQDAALAFAVLTEHGLEVEEVVRGVIGPGWLPGTTPCGPAPLHAVGLQQPALTAALERASRDLSGGRVDDPLAVRVTVPGQGATFGLAGMRKWAVAKGDRGRLRAWLAGTGSRNLVYGWG